MKYIKLSIISIVVLFIITTLFSLFIPSEVKVSRAINVYADTAHMLEKVRDLALWREWYPGFDTLPMIVLKREGERVTQASLPGAQIAITGNEPGRVTARFSTSGKPAVLSMHTALQIPGADSATLQWYLQFRLRWYPWEKFSSLFFEKTYGSRMEKGLANLKQILESDRSSHDVSRIGRNHYFYLP